MSKKIIFIGVVLLAVLLLTSVSTITVAWIHSDDTEDVRFEEFGPRADGLLIQLHSDYVAEFTAFECGEFDLVDYPLPWDYVEKWSSPPYSEFIKVVPYGSELEMFVIDINNNPNPYLGNPPNSSYLNPVYPNPCSVPSFRHALAHLMDRAYVADKFWEEYGVPMYTPVPPSMPNYVHPEIVPGGDLDDLCHLYSPTEAAHILDTCDEAPADGMPDFPINPDGWRFWDRNGDGVKQPEESLRLEFYIGKNDPRMDNLGTWYADKIESINVHVNRRYTGFMIGPVVKTTSPVLGIPCFPIVSAVYVSLLDEVIEKKNFHLFTGYWSLRSIPDHLAVYTSNNYGHPDSCHNYDAVNCTDFDHWVDVLFHANTYDEAEFAAYVAQEAFADPELDGIGCIPVVCSKGYKAHQRRYVGNTLEEEALGYTGQLWNGIVNEPSHGLDSWWSFLNMHPEGHPTGDGEHMTIRWGTQGLVGTLNPIYPNMRLGCHILRLIYDSLLRRDPHTGEWTPWLCKDFEVGTWVDPVDGLTKCKVKFTIRSDICWHDGVPFSAADVIYTLWELPRDLRAAGFWPSYWSGNVHYIKSFYLIDPCNIEILFNTKSVWALSWIGGNIILPKHVWKPLIDSCEATGQPYLAGFSPDPDLIGTGNWRFVEYDELSHVYMTKNQKCKTITTNLHNELGPARPVHNPCEVYRTCPVHANVHTLKEYLWVGGEPPIPPYVSSQWHQVKGPENCTEWHLEDWIDNDDGVLS